ncbi:SMI1/KNR4 family protein [Streptomyces sp. S.PNR 29]|uniref:SMI1/KNR4 family protein n=1 Tax=Streptomyces sp. S.PNR 29 TaxID=2973805 RepID=UPI0025B1BFED|nr:SMI1/KNR4 family protein [Streptomyces sp. S.PNR 29]MDN0200836.1 SMI1/KNR4 family protein [Streptomyces sp. S.PNR 29]
MTRAVEASEQVIRLVHENEDIVNHADGCDAGVLAAAERELGFAFPPSYRRLLEELGTWDIGGTEFLGVYQTPARGDALLGSVEQTLEARSRTGLPPDLMVVMVDDVWGFVVLDTSQADKDGEYPVFAWNPGLPDRDSMEKVADNFGSFALEECRQALRQ